MPQLELEQGSDLTTLSAPSFSVRFKKLMKWVKDGITNHPVITCAIVAAIITAAIFTGGALIAGPIALLIMSQIAGFVSLACSAIFALMASSVPHPYMADIEVSGDEFRRADMKKGMLGMFSMMALYAAVIAFICPPVFGVVICGIFATVLGSGVAGSFSHLATSSGKATSSGDTAGGPPQQKPLIGHPSLQVLSQLSPATPSTPAVAAPAEHQKKESAEPVVTQSIADQTAPVVEESTNTPVFR